jgi:hypothetical protein
MRSRHDGAEAARLQVTDAVEKWPNVIGFPIPGAFRPEGDLGLDGRHRLGGE